MTGLSNKYVVWVAVKNFHRNPRSKNSTPMKKSIRLFYPGFFLIWTFKKRYIRLQIFAFIQPFQRLASPQIRLIGWFKRQVLNRQVLQGLFGLAKCQPDSCSPQFPTTDSSLHIINDQHIHISDDRYQTGLQAGKWCDRIHTAL